MGHCWVRSLVLSQEGESSAGCVMSTSLTAPPVMSCRALVTNMCSSVRARFPPAMRANPAPVIAAISGLLAVLSIPFMHETYAPVLRMKYDLASGDPEKAMNARRHLGAEVQLGQWKFLWNNLSRPVLLLTRSFICFVLSLYMALIYGIYYLMFATFTGTCLLRLHVSHFSCEPNQNSSLELTGSELEPLALPISVSASGSSSLLSSVHDSRTRSTPTIELNRMVSESLRCGFLP